MITQAQAIEMAAAIRALGVSAIARYMDRAVEDDTGAYTGEVAKDYRVEASITDARSGNIVVRTLTDPVSDPAALVAEMRSEVSQRAAATRGRIARERRHT